MALFFLGINIFGYPLKNIRLVIPPVIFTIPMTVALPFLLTDQGTGNWLRSTFGSEREMKGLTSKPPIMIVCKIIPSNVPAFL